MRAEHWRQESPRAQAIVTVGAIEGWISNLEDGATSPERLIEMVTPLIADLRLLLRTCLQDQWSPNSEASPEALTKFKQEAESILDRLKQSAKQT